MIRRRIRTTAAVVHPNPCSEIPLGYHHRTDAGIAEPGREAEEIRAGVEALITEAEHRGKRKVSIAALMDLLDEVAAREAVAGDPRALVSRCLYAYPTEFCSVGAIAEGTGLSAAVVESALAGLEEDGCAYSVAGWSLTSFGKSNMEQDSNDGWEDFDPKTGGVI